MEYYVKIENEKVTRIFNYSWIVNGENLEQRQGAKILQIPILDLQKVSFLKTIQSRANSKHNYIVDNGTARLKTDPEIAEENKPKKKQEAFQLHRDVVSDMRVEANGEIYAFDNFSMIFFLAEYSLNGQNGFEWKPKRKPERLHTATEVAAIFTASRKIIRDSFKAYNDDRLDILNNADFSMSRLNGELDKQKALKES